MSEHTHRWLSKKCSVNLKLFQIFKNSKINVLSGIFTTKEIISFQNYKEKTFYINLQQDSMFSY